MFDFMSNPETILDMIVTLVALIGFAVAVAFFISAFKERPQMGPLYQDKGVKPVRYTKRDSRGRFVK